MSVQSDTPPQRFRSRAPDPKYMTFVEHLQELRQRLVKSVLAVGAGSVIGWILAPRAIHLLDAPLRHFLGPHGGQLVATTIYGGFTLQLKIAVMIGFMIALPITLYQLWAFVAPAFGPGANRWAPIWIISALVLFAAGALTGYFVIPLAISFFTKYQSPDVRILVVASDYVGFISLILIVFGISFELPLVLVSLSAIGITSSRWLSSKRLVAFFAVFLFAMIATPGADLISPLVLGGILYILFEISILVSRLIGK
jgi:sec-independent protein translocase protein TatC